MHTLSKIGRLFSNSPQISMADGKIVRSFGILSSLSFYFLLRPPTAPYVLIVLMCVPTMCLRSTLSLTPVHRVHHVADFLWLNLLSTISTFPTPRPARLPPADILLSTFVDTSRPFQDCTDLVSVSVVSSLPMSVICLHENMVERFLLSRFF